MQSPCCSFIVSPLFLCRAPACVCMCVCSFPYARCDKPYANSPHALEQQTHTRILQRRRSKHVHLTISPSPVQCTCAQHRRWRRRCLLLRRISALVVVHLHECLAWPFMYAVLSPKLILKSVGPLHEHANCVCVCSVSLLFLL